MIDTPQKFKNKRKEVIVVLVVGIIMSVVRIARLITRYYDWKHLYPRAETFINCGDNWEDKSLGEQNLEKQQTR